MALAVQLGSFVNVIVQAGLLALSLTALAYDRDVVPPWVAITLAVGGILLLAWALVAGANFRKEFEDFELVRKTHERPD